MAAILALPVLLSATLAMLGLLALVDSLRRPLVFDPRHGFHQNPSWLLAVLRSPRYRSRLEGLHVERSELGGVQVLAKRARVKTGFAFQLNLALKDGSRHTLSCHNDLLATRRDAELLSRALSLPVWDATVGRRFPRL